MRKLEKKLKFYAKVKESATTSLGAKKTIDKKKKRIRSRQKKLRAYDLSSLSEFLPDPDACKKLTDTTSTKLNCKSRQKLLQRENFQMKAVLNNPVFQMDPIAAIQQHLESTQPPPTTENKKKSHGKNGKAKKKAKSKNKGGNGASSSAPVAMEM